MDRDEIFERVREVVSDDLGINEAEITVDSRLFDDLGAEPVQCVELVAAMEDEFEIELHEDVVLEIETVGDLVDLIADVVEDVPEQ